MKKFFITLLVLVVLVAVFIGFVALCRWQNWLPEFTEPVLKFFNIVGLKFLNNI